MLLEMIGPRPGEGRYSLLSEALDWLHDLGHRRQKCRRYLVAVKHPDVSVLEKLVNSLKSRRSKPLGGKDQLRPIGC